MSDIVRILRILEYTGPRELVEKTIENSIKGTVTHGKLRIRAATLGDFPDIWIKDQDNTEDEGTPS